MRRTSAIVLMSVGMFLLVVAVLAQVYAPDHLKKTPLDLDVVTYLSGTAVLDGESVPIKIKNTTVTDSEASDEDVVVWKTASCVVIDRDQAPDCVSADDPGGRLIDASTDTFATDRVDALVVNDEQYAPGAGVREGLQNKWPFDSEKTTYPYWDGTTGSAHDAVFDRVEDLHGVEVYVYKMTVTDAAVEIVEGVDGLYSSNTEFWVEPRTGDILNQIEDQTRTTPDGDPVLSVQAQFTDEQQEASAEESKKNLALLDLLQKWVPLAGYLGGTLAIVAGVALYVTGRRREEVDVRHREKASA